MKPTMPDDVPDFWRCYLFEQAQFSDGEVPDDPRRFHVGASTSGVRGL